MEVVHERCCGVDIHKDSLCACVKIKQGGRIEQDKQRFGTTAEELGRFRDWLRERDVNDVAMEATGVYWRAVWKVLEEAGLQLLLVNPQHLKAIPGKKTDFKDGERLADLHQHGLLRGSFVPGEEQRQLRDLTRTRTRLVQEMARVENRLQKTLEDADIKLGSVASSVVSLTGRRIIEAVIAGETDPVKLADLACGKLREKIPWLQKALRGRVNEHHRYMLQLWMQELKHLESTIDSLDRRIHQKVEPFRSILDSWIEVPGISWITACAILAEIGSNMAQFPTAAQLASWACLCPGNQESAGKRISGRTRPGNPWLRSMLCQAGWAASHAKNSYFQALFRRICRYRGSKRALIAVAHSLLRTLYYLQQQQVRFVDPGRDYFDRLDQHQRKRSYIRQLERMGFQVTLCPAAG